MTWLWFVGALVLGGALLVAATALDVRSLRRRQWEGAVVPLRGDDAVDAHVPTYITQDEIDVLPRGEGATGAPSGVGFHAGVAHPDLLPAKGRASLEEASVVVVEGRIDAMRQLLPLLATHEPLLIVAGEVAAEVARTLAANRLRLHLPVLACEADAGDLFRIVELVGGEVLTDYDLRAGYLPAQALGHAARVETDRRRLWIDVG